MKKCVLHVYLFILIHLSTVSPSLPLSSYISLSPIFPSLHSSNGSTVLVPGSEILSYQGYKTSWLWYDDWTRRTGYPLPNTNIHYTQTH